MSNQYLTFDVTKANQVQQLIVGRQGDNALKTVSMLFWDGEKNRPYDLTGKQVYFEALKPDNSHIVDYAGITITDPKYGLATYAFNEQVFTVQGMMQQAFFKISETNASGKVTTDSALEVSINVLSNSVEFGIKSEDYLSEYDRLIADVEKKFDDYANAVSGNIAEVSKAHDDIQALMKQISDNNIVTINEFNLTKDEVQSARTNTSGKTYPSLGDRINDEEASLINNMNAKISQISSVPETFANLSALQTAYPNGKTGLFVTADNGHKYIWANGSWSDAGIYQAVGIADSSLEPTKLTKSAQNNGISEGVYSPLVKSNIVNNTLVDTSVLPEHLIYPLSIKVDNADPNNVYLLLQVSHDEVNNVYGATFGYAPRIDDNSFDANEAKSLNYGQFSNTPPVVDQYGHVTRKYVFGDLVITITYRTPGIGQIRMLYFGNIELKKFFDACIIDVSNYNYNLKSRGMEKNYNVNYPLVKYNPAGNTNPADNQAALDPHRKALRDIKIINPEANTSYLIAGIYNNADAKQFGVQFAKANRIDGVSFNISDVTLLNSLSTLSREVLPVDSDGNTTYTVRYGNTVISATYNTSDMGSYQTRLLYLDGTAYYDISLISESTFINLPESVKSKGYKKPTWLGDSITEINSKATIHYHEIIASEWGSTTSTNLGISGSTIGNHSNPMSVRYTQIPADTDFISVFGGINDYGLNQPLGQYGDTTNETFYGGLYVLLNGLQTKFPTVPKIFISPMHIGSEFGDFTSTVNGLGLSQDVYEQAIVEMTRKFGIPHLSLFSDMGVTFAVKAQSDYYSADSLHPNDAGQTLIAEKILNFLK